MRHHPLKPAELSQAARSCAVFRVGGCDPDYLRQLLTLLLEEEAPALAAKVRGLSPAQVLALRADLAPARRARRDPAT